MDNKYGLGGAKVATAHHEQHKPDSEQPITCRYCFSATLMLCPTLNDHYCKVCGQYQSDVPMDYSTGHSTDY